MARSYTVKPDRLDAVSIFIDTRFGNLQILHDRDVFKRATGQENPPMSMVIDVKNPLPEGVFKEMASFAPMTFAVSEEIDKETISYDDDPKQPGGQKVKLDLTKRTYLRILYLLRSWTLSESDKNLTLTTYKRPDGRLQLTNESMNLINNVVDPKIVRGFMEAYEFSQRISAQQIEEEAIKALADASGGKINVKN